MPVTYIDTNPSVFPVTYTVSHTLFTGQNQGINLAAGASLPIGTRLLGVLIHKEVAFDSNTISFGSGIVSAVRGDIADSSEVAATTAGIVEPTAWKAGGKFADLLLTGPRGVHVFLGEGALPTVGLMRITLLTWRPSPRGTL